MKNLANSTAVQQVSAVKTKKEWQKPVLDILSLENAQHGTKGQADGSILHHSG